jgi:phage protein D
MSTATTATATKQPFVAAAIEGSNVSEVRSLRIEDHDRLIDEAVIELYDRERLCTDFVAEGQRIEILIGWQGSDAVEMFEGAVRRVEAVGAAGDRRVVKVTAYDPSYRMMRTPEQMTIPHEGKLSSIITDIVEAHGIEVESVTVDPDPTFEEPQALLQTGKTDWQFIQDLTLAYGGRAFVELNDGEPRFYLMSEDELLSQDPVAALRQCQGFNQIKKMEVKREAARASTRQLVATVDPETGEVEETERAIPVPEAPSLPDTDHAATLAQRYGSEASARYVAAAALSAQATETPADQRTDAAVPGLPSDPRLIGLLEQPDRTRLLGLKATGTAVGDTALRAKCRVNISGISAWADGDWYLQKVVHEVTMSDGQNGIYQTHFTATR